MNSRKKQQGVVLIISLLALVAISLAGVALMRTVDTSNVVSGNVAFNETASQVAEIGADAAYTQVNSNLYSYFQTTGNAICLSDATKCPTNGNGQTYFYPNVSSISAVSKLPSDANGNPLPMSDAVSILLPGDVTPSFTVQYMIERMCTGTASITEVATFTKCRAVPVYLANGSMSPFYSLAYVNAQAALGTTKTSTGKLFYRITVLVNGPRNTRAQTQYFYGVQDTVYQ